MEWMNNPAWWALGIAVVSLALGLTNAWRDRSDRLGREVIWVAMPPEPFGDTRVRLSLRNIGTRPAWYTKISAESLSGVAVDGGRPSGLRTDPSERISFTIPLRDQDKLPESTFVEWDRRPGDLYRSAHVDTLLWKQPLDRPGTRRDSAGGA